jgi:hypothetical protein
VLSSHCPRWQAHCNLQPQRRGVPGQRGGEDRDPQDSGRAAGHPQRHPSAAHRLLACRHGGSERRLPAKPGQVGHCRVEKATLDTRGALVCVCVMDGSRKRRRRVQCTTKSRPSWSGVGAKQRTYGGTSESTGKKPTHDIPAWSGIVVVLQRETGGWTLRKP